MSQAKTWRYCPSCYRLADNASLLKHCPYCIGRPNNRLTVLPLDNEAAQAAIRIGGTKALEEMIIGLVAGEDVILACHRAHQHCTHSPEDHEDMGWTCDLWPIGGPCCGG